MAKKYIWNKKTDREYQLWPNRSREHYLTAPFVPMSEINRQSDSPLVTKPAAENIDYLSRHSIASSAITSHKKGYYQSRNGVNFHFLVYTLSGEADLSIDRKHFKLTHGKAFVSPMGTSYDISCENADWNIVWFHMTPGNLWNRAFGAGQQIFRSKILSELSKIVEMYAEEIYSSTPSFILLESYANIIAEQIKRDFLVGSQTPLEEGLKKLLDSLAADPSQNISCGDAANLLRTEKRKINDICVKNWSCTFQQFAIGLKMKKACELLLNSGLSNVKIAEKLGYSDAYVFSRAFKCHYGESPTNFVKKSFGKVPSNQ